MISKPDVNISLVSANNVLGVATRRNLIVCQTPNATANALVQNIQDKTQSELDALLGAGSYSRVMVQQWLDANRTGNNVGAELDMITLLDGVAATAATKTITVVGTTTAAGSMSVSILSSELYNKTITLASGDDETDIADAITAAYAATTAPFTVGNVAGVVTVTATDLGTIGNDYGIEIKNVPAGVTSITLADGVTGATPPTVTDVMDLVGTRRYQGVLWPSDLLSSVTEVSDFLDNRFNVSNDVLDGVAFVGESNTLSLAKAAANAHNSQSLVLMGNALTVGKEVWPTTAIAKIGPEVLHPVDFTTAAFIGIRARRLSDGASISSVVVATASNDQFGGIATASLPYFNTPLDGVPVTESVDVFDGAEQAELNADGFSVVGPNRPITETLTGAVVTTYKTDDAGNEDVSFKYLNYVDTASLCREFIFNNFKAIFAQSRLTDGDLIAGRSMENAASIKAVFKRLLDILKDNALVRDGREADKIVDDSLVVVLDLAGRSATLSSVLPIVTQLETINVPLQLTFEQ